MEHIDMDQPIYLQVVDRVKQYPYGASRSDIAADFGFSKSTAKEHLEKAVSRNLLRKQKTWIKQGYRGWVYYDPAQQPESLISRDPDDDQEDDPPDTIEEGDPDFHNYESWYNAEHGQDPPDPDDLVSEPDNEWTGTDAWMRPDQY